MSDTVQPNDYPKGPSRQFVRDMLKAGREPYHYRGRWYWEGPAVDIEVEDYEDVIRETKVQLQRDQMGLGLVVYPRIGASRLPFPDKE